MNPNKSQKVGANGQCKPHTCKGLLRRIEEPDEPRPARQLRVPLIDEGGHGRHRQGHLRATGRISWESGGRQGPAAAVNAGRAIEAERRAGGNGERDTRTQSRACGVARGSAVVAAVCPVLCLQQPGWSYRAGTPGRESQTCLQAGCTARSARLAPRRPRRTSRLRPHPRKRSRRAPPRRSSNAARGLRPPSAAFGYLWHFYFGHSVALARWLPPLGSCRRT